MIFYLLGDLVDIVVDPYVIKEKNLSDYVASYLKEAGVNFSVVKRNSTRDPKLYQCFLITDLQPPSPKLLAQKSDSTDLTLWADEIEKRGGLLLKNYYRFLKYLHQGTYLPICTQVATLKSPDYESLAIPFAQDFSDDIMVGYTDDGIYYDGEYEYYDGEYESIDEELNDYQNGWTRSSDEGWFYADDEDELSLDELEDSENIWI